MTFTFTTVFSLEYGSFDYARQLHWIFNNKKGKSTHSGLYPHCELTNRRPTAKKTKQEFLQPLPLAMNRTVFAEFWTSRIILSPAPHRALPCQALSRVPSGCSPLGTDWQLLRSSIPPPQRPPPDSRCLQVSLVQTGSSQERKKRGWVRPPLVKKKETEKKSSPSLTWALITPPPPAPSPTFSALPPAGSIHQADRSRLPLVWYLPVSGTKWERWQRRRDVFGFFSAAAASLRDATRWTAVWDPGRKCSLVLLHWAAPGRNC